ncbi:MAG: hypothetical protein BHW32_06135 [Firmicutes bacterium CAG:129_59_24]|nr:MAG: hypothetical protein BHW32_06135 [Firmicutes bacterium CAG:129_59_24]
MKETLKYLQFDNWEQSAPGLARSRELLGLLGNPEKKLKFVHIAGTNGKGSTAAMLASVLQHAGYRTGLYTSPHLLRFHERMRVNGEEIDDESLISLTNTVRSAAESMSELPTGFEIMTAIAFLYFVQEQCDIVSLEVGLGGRMDSTNVIPAPEVCVVANIGLEHTAILGDTVEKIAAEKCGIIKHGAHAVLFGQSEGVENVAREKCAQEDVALTITAQEKLERISSSLDGQEFKYRGRGPYHLRLLGEYQLLNALTVIDVCNALRSRGWDKLTDEAIDEGLSHAQWPGRLELLRRGPDFIVDGAHNPQCVDALMDSLAALYGDKKLIFLTGVLRDKDWQQMLRRALPLAKAFVVITPPSARALDENELAAWLNAQGVQAVPAKDTDDGVRRALALAGEDDAICSWGSLYFTGEVRRVLTEQ